jgi:hypothetical protein
MSYSPVFPAAIDVPPLPYPLVQQPMVLRPPRNAYGEMWFQGEWDENDMYAWFPVPNPEYVMAAAVLGAGVMALMGKTANKSLVLGAAGGVALVTALSALTTRT